MREIIQGEAPIGTTTIFDSSTKGQCTFNVKLINKSGTTATYTVHIVPEGGAPDNTTVFIWNGKILGTELTGKFIKCTPFHFPKGPKVVLVTDKALTYFIEFYNQDVLNINI